MRALVLVTVLGVSGVPGLSANALAQPVVHKEGEYTGVGPNKPSETPAAPKRSIGKATLSWVGFAAKDGGAEVFFQSPTKFEVTQDLEGTTLVVKLAGLTRQVTNTRRPIDTRFFDNPLARITAAPGKRAKKKARGIDVRIVFKNPKDAKAGTLRLATEADGLYYAYLSFPEGADSSVIPSSPNAPVQLSAPGASDDLGDTLDEPTTSPSEVSDDEVPDQPVKKKTKASIKK